MKYFIGTCGWNYSSFKGIFFPEELKSKDWLKYYAEHLNTVEINVTFYRLPRVKTFEKWYNETPEDFVFSIKASKVITHIKRLKDVENELKTFLERLKGLKEKGRVLLFQFPPSLKFDKELLENFLKILPKDYQNVIEIRHKSFHCEEFVKLLKKYKVCLCFSDCAGRYPSWYEVQTAPFLYIRMHGSKKLYVSNYEEEELKELAQKINSYKVKEAYVYFDNTALGYAITNALYLKELLKS